MRRSRLGDDQYDLIRTQMQTDPKKVRDAWEIYKKSFDDNADRFAGAAREAAVAAYTCTVLSAKPDPLGRHVLLDHRTRRDGRYDTDTVLVLAGAEQPIVYASVYQDNGRQHGAPGARVRRAGLGSVAYMCSALGAYVWAGHDETYSPSPGNPDHNRTSSADRVWEDLNRYGAASRSDDGTSSESNSREHCVYVNGDEIEVTDIDGNDVTATITSDEVCGDVDYEYEIEIQTDHLPHTAIMETDLVAFTLGTFLRPTLDSAWALEGRELRQKSLTADYNDPDESPFTDFDTKPATAHLLARAYHGPSLALILYIAKTIKAVVDEDLMVAYLRRPDIAHAAAGHPRYLELLGQQVLPGFSGISRAALNEIRGAHFAAAKGKLMIDISRENPLDLPKLPASVQRRIDKLPEE